MDGLRATRSATCLTVSQDLCLLGAPFLLQKAAHAAAAFESEESAVAAAELISACAELKTLLEHPELVALNTLALHTRPSSSGNHVRAASFVQQVCTQHQSGEHFAPRPYSPVKSCSSFDSPESSPGLSMVSAASQQPSPEQQLTAEDSGQGASLEPAVLVASLAELRIGESAADAPLSSLQQAWVDEEKKSASCSPQSPLCFDAQEAFSVCLTTGSQATPGTTSAIQQGSQPVGSSSSKLSPRRLFTVADALSKQPATAEHASPQSRAQAEGAAFQDFESPASSILQLSPDGPQEEQTQPHGSPPAVELFAEADKITEHNADVDTPLAASTSERPTTAPQESTSFYTVQQSATLWPPEAVRAFKPGSVGLPIAGRTSGRLHREDWPTISQAVSATAKYHTSGQHVQPAGITTHSANTPNIQQEKSAAKGPSAKHSSSEAAGPSSPPLSLCQPASLSRVPQSTVLKQKRLLVSSDDENSSPTGHGATRADSTEQNNLAVEEDLGIHLSATIAPQAYRRERFYSPEGASGPQGSTNSVGAAQEVSAASGQSLPPIELSSDSNEEDCLVLTAPHTVPRTRRPNLVESSSSDEDDQPCTPQQLPAPTPSWVYSSVPKQLPTTPAQAPKTTAAFKRQRATLAAAFFAEFNENAFGGQLPRDVPITWSAKLLTTAGLTHYKREVMEGRDEARYSASVELSSKVVDNVEKLRSTLMHELCHVAAWVINHVHKPPHGAIFKQWASRAKRCFPDLDVSTCHSYDIHLPFRWKCTNARCNKIFKRHSNSIDTAKKICGICRSWLEFQGRFNQDGTPAAKRRPSQYSLFVKDNFSAVKEACPPGTPNASVLKALAARWRDQKAEQVASAGRQPMAELNATTIT